MLMDALYNPNPPWIYLDPITEEDGNLIPAIRYRLASTNCRSQIVVRVLRGRKMRSVPALMDELSAALQFDEPFGENWNAVIDCLHDLYVWMPGDTYILFIRDAQDVLCDEQSDALRTFLETLNHAGKIWSQPIDDNQQFNRPAVPFHTLLKYPREKALEVRKRYKAFSDLVAWSDPADRKDS